MTQPLESLIRHLQRVAGPPGDGLFPDIQLLERWARHRDEVAFELLLRRHGPMVLATCRRLLGDAHAAEDAFQATWATGQHPPKVEWLTDGELAEALGDFRDLRERLRVYRGENEDDYGSSYP
jgi:hypothetical protein